MGVKFVARLIDAPPRGLDLDQEASSSGELGVETSGLRLGVERDCAEVVGCRAAA
jgi:hypothetical protein